MGQLPLERIRLDDPLGPRLLAFLLVLDLDQVTLADAFRERGDEVGFRVTGAWFGRLRELELAERLLELLADAVERRVRVRGDHRADEFEREADGARLQWCQARGKSEGVTVQLFVDMDAFSLERGVDGVTPPAEVDEVEQLQMLLELILGNVKALDDLPCGNRRVVPLTARCEQVCEERLQYGETFGDNRARGSLADPVRTLRRRGCG